MNSFRVVILVGAINHERVGGRSIEFFSFSQLMQKVCVAGALRLRKPPNFSIVTDGGFLEDEERPGHPWLSGSHRIKNESPRDTGSGSLVVDLTR